MRAYGNCCQGEPGPVWHIPAGPTRPGPARTSAAQSGRARLALRLVKPGPALPVPVFGVEIGLGPARGPVAVAFATCKYLHQTEAFRVRGSLAHGQISESKVNDRKRMAAVGTAAPSATAGFCHRHSSVVSRFECTYNVELTA